MTELTGVGAELRQAREAQGLAVTDVAQQLKFAPRQIESLEAERFERLPGPTIARGMVRNYARLLKLDPEALVARMGPHGEPATAPEELAARFKRPVPFSDSSRRSTLVYVGLSAAVLLAVGSLAYKWQREQAAPQFVAPVEQAAPVPAAPEPKTQTASAAQLPQVVSEPPPPPPPPESEKAESAEAKSEPQPEKPQLAAVAPKPPPQPADEKPVAAGTVHSVVLRCAEEAWLEVRNDEGEALISSLNPAGSERSVRARGPLHLVIGNAQHVTLIVDGKPVDLKPHTRVEVARLTLP